MRGDAVVFPARDSGKRAAALSRFTRERVTTARATVRIAEAKKHATRARARNARASWVR